ncbi:MAG: dienelactone hydrolase family protein [Actinomadura sp.]
MSGQGAIMSVRLPVGGVHLEGELTEPSGARAVVVFAHGSGSGRHSPRNQAVAAELAANGFATLLFDLLTAEEEREDALTARLRFDVALLAGRLGEVVDWVRGETAPGRAARVGLFGASTGAAAALVTAADHLGDVGAVVSRGGRPDLAGDALDAVRAPTLLIVGGRDVEVLSLNERALVRLGADAGHELVVVPGAGHLFAEPGALEKVSHLAVGWFGRHLPAESGHTNGPAA